jgi:hypothetical protein
MYTLVKEIRRTEVYELKAILKRKLDEMEEPWIGVQNFRLHGQNRVFVKFLLSRITSYIEQQSGLNSSFEKYYHNPGGKSFEVEHILADKYASHKEEFEQESDFQEYRNRIGALVLLPRGTNQSYGAKSYDEKLNHYIKENLLVQSLCPLTYQNNPNFLSMKNKLALPFKFHEEFRRADISDRQKLYQAICESIWGTKYLCI